MTVTHTHFPYTGEFCVSFTSYFQNIENWMAGQRLLSGCLVARASASSVTIAAGTYMAGTQATVTYAGGTVTGITACTALNLRFDQIYLDTSDGVVKLSMGTEGIPLLPDNGDGINYFLENKVPQPGNLPSETSILLAVICVTSSGIRSGNNGSYSTAGVADMRFTAPIGSILISYLEAANQTRGDIIARGASVWQRLAIGTANQYLKTDGTDPSWSALNIPDLYVSTQARGDLITRGASAWQGFSAGTAGKFLMANGAAADLTWAYIPFASFYDDAQARGDIIMRGASNWQRFAASSTSGQVLTSAGAGADLTWTTPHAQLHAAQHVTGGNDVVADAVAGGNSGLMSGAMLTKLNGIATGADVTSANNPKAHATSHVTGGSDVIASVVAGGNAGLMIGTDKTKLNGIATGADVTGSNTPMAHASRHVTGGGDTIASVVADGNAGLMIGTDKTKLNNLVNQRELIMPFNNSGNVFAAGILTYIPLNLGTAMTLTGVEMLCAPSGSIVVDIWKTTYASYDVSSHPVDADSITSATPPTISSGVKMTNNTMTSWTKSFAADDVIAINVDSCSTVTKFTLVMKFSTP